MRWIAIVVFFKARYIFVYSIARLSTEVNHGRKNYSTPGRPSPWDWKCGDKKMGAHGNIFTPYWLGLWGKNGFHFDPRLDLAVVWLKKRAFFVTILTSVQTQCAYSQKITPVLNIFCM